MKILLELNPSGVANLKQSSQLPSGYNDWIGSWLAGWLAGWMHALVEKLFCTWRLFRTMRKREWGVPRQNPRRLNRCHVQKMSQDEIWTQILSLQLRQAIVLTTVQACVRACVVFTWHPVTRALYISVVYVRSRLYLAAHHIHTPG